MSREVRMALVEEFPDFFRSPQRALEVGDGWLPIVKRLCQGLAAKLSPEDAKAFVFDNMKSKFCQLRVHHSGVPWDHPVVRELVVQAEKEADVACEKCGTSNGITPGAMGGVKLCPICRKNREHQPWGAFAVYS